MKTIVVVLLISVTLALNQSIVFGLPQWYGGYGGYNPYGYDPYSSFWPGWNKKNKSEFVFKFSNFTRCL